MASKSIRRFLSHSSLLVGIAIACLICLTPVGQILERTLVGHVLIEIPLLVVAGWALGAAIKPYLHRALGYFNGGGISGLLLVTFTIAFWMIPRWLDASLQDPVVGIAKYTSLIFIAGMPLGLSWQRAGFITRGVVKLEFLAMLFRLGWLYLISPERLCNSYLISDQSALGQTMLLIGGLLCVVWLVPLFVGAQPEEGSSAPSTS